MNNPIIIFEDQDGSVFIISFQSLFLYYPYLTAILTIPIGYEEL